MATHWSNLFTDFHNPNLPVALPRETIYYPAYFPNTMFRSQPIINTPTPVQINYGEKARLRKKKYKEVLNRKRRKMNERKDRGETVKYKEDLEAFIARDHPEDAIITRSFMRAELKRARAKTLKTLLHSYYPAHDEINKLPKDTVMGALLDKYFGMQPAFIRRVSEKKNMEEDGLNMRNLDLELAGTYIPTDIVLEILSYLTYGPKLLLDGLGRVNSDWYLAVLFTWRAPVFLKSSHRIREISLIVLRHARCLKIGTNLRKSDLDYLFCNIFDAGPREIDFSAASAKSVHSFLDHANRRSKVFTATRRLKFCRDTIRSEQRMSLTADDVIFLTTIFPNASELINPQAAVIKHIGYSHKVTTVENWPFETAPPYSNLRHYHMPRVWPLFERSTQLIESLKTLKSMKSLESLDIAIYSFKMYKYILEHLPPNIRSIKMMGDCLSMAMTKYESIDIYKNMDMLRMDFTVAPYTTLSTIEIDNIMPKQIKEILFKFGGLKRLTVHLPIMDVREFETTEKLRNWTLYRSKELRDVFLTLFDLDPTSTSIKKVVMTQDIATVCYVTVCVWPGQSVTVTLELFSNRVWNIRKTDKLTGPNVLINGLITALDIRKQFKRVLNVCGDTKGIHAKTMMVHKEIKSRLKKGLFNEKGIFKYSKEKKGFYKTFV